MLTNILISIIRKSTRTRSIINKMKLTAKKMLWIYYTVDSGSYNKLGKNRIICGIRYSHESTEGEKVIAYPGCQIFPLHWWSDTE